MVQELLDRLAYLYTLGLSKLQATNRYLVYVENEPTYVFACSALTPWGMYLLTRHWDSEVKSKWGDSGGFGTHLLSGRAWLEIEWNFSISVQELGYGMVLYHLEDDSLAPRYEGIVPLNNFPEDPSPTE